ncbi:MAG: nitroreductase family protein [Magnetococcales bacterium]|nr:nitroreductase family protein [Magnetococcales bacterium]
MDVFTAIETRRAVKQFNPDHRMTPEEERRLLALAMLSPTAFNIQHWRFVLVKDPELRRQLREAAWNQAQVTDSSLLIVMCADLQAWRKDPGRYWRLAPEAVRDYLVPAIAQYYEGREPVQRDEGMRSCGIAAQTIMLAAQGLGYDSCPMDGFDFDAVARLINLPPDHAIALMIAVGQPLQPARSRAGQLEYDDVVIENRF